MGGRLDKVIPNTVAGPAGPICQTHLCRNKRQNSRDDSVASEMGSHTTARKNRDATCPGRRVARSTRIDSRPWGALERKQH